jgi:hypothetical protein
MDLPVRIDDAREDLRSTHVDPHHALGVCHGWLP